MNKNLAKITASFALAGSLFLIGCQKPNSYFSLEERPAQECYESLKYDGSSMEVYALNEVKGLFGRVSARTERLLGKVRFPTERKSSEDLCFSVKAYDEDGMISANVKFPTRELTGFTTVPTGTYLIKISINGVDKKMPLEIMTKDAKGDTNHFVTDYQGIMDYFR
jgi:hypothetical protein